MQTFKRLCEIFGRDDFSAFGGDIKLCYSCLQDISERFIKYFEDYCNLAIIDNVESFRDMFMAVKRRKSKILQLDMENAVSSINIINGLCKTYNIPPWTTINVENPDSVHRFIITFVLSRLQEQVE